MGTKCYALILLPAAAALLLAGCGSQETGNGPSSQQLYGSDKTAELYKAQCITCHGSDLKGRMGPMSDIHNAGSRLTAQQIKTQIEQGGSLMPAFKERLSPEEIQSLTEWLSTKK